MEITKVTRLAASSKDAAIFYEALGRAINAPALERLLEAVKVGRWPARMALTFPVPEHGTEVTVEIDLDEGVERVLVTFEEPRPWFVRALVAHYLAEGGDLFGLEIGDAIAAELPIRELARIHALGKLDTKHLDLPECFVPEETGIPEVCARLGTRKECSDCPLW